MTYVTITRIVEVSDKGRKSRDRAVFNIPLQKIDRMRRLYVNIFRLRSVLFEYSEQPHRFESRQEAEEYINQLK